MVFDCDSTLTAIEGIEELGREHRDEIQRLTDDSMEGRVPLEEVYGERLALAQPHRSRVDTLIHRYIEALVPDARETVAALLAEGIEVRILSGGMLPAVRAVAAELGLAPEAVGAVDVYFDEDGRYSGFDETSPLSRGGGKLVVLEQWRREVPTPILLVGDGATDLEARDAADAFVAFAGVVERPNVMAAADVVVRANSLAPILPLALAGEPPRNAARAALYERGWSLLDDAARAALVPGTLDPER